MTQENLKKIVPVILCGGSGTRLSPLSTPDKPKQFLKLINNNSLLQNTVLRAMNVADVKANQVVTITLNDLANKTAEEYRQVQSALCDHLVLETCSRNTAAAVALSAIYVREVFGSDAMMWVLPADHHIGDDAALAQSLQSAVYAAQQNYLTTFGIEPTRAETGYGYIKRAAMVDTLDNAYSIDRFVEKPDAKKAQEYITRGGYFWNSGMFVFKVETIIEAFKENSMGIFEAVENSVLFKDKAIQVIQDKYQLVPKEPIDTAIMEKADNIAVVPSDLDWSDIGSWQSLYELKGEQGLLALLSELDSEKRQEIMGSLNVNKAKAA